MHHLVNLRLVDTRDNRSVAIEGKLYFSMYNTLILVFTRIL